MNKRKISLDSIIIIILTVVISLFLLIDYINRSELSKNSYQNLNEIKVDKAIKRGWIPSNIPESAYNIYEEHRIDETCSSGSFKYLEKDENIFISNLEYKNGRYIKNNFKFKIDKEENRVEFKFLTKERKEKILRDKNLFDIFLVSFGILSILYGIFYSPILFYKSIKCGIKYGWKSNGVKNTMFYENKPIQVLLVSIFFFIGGIYLFNEKFFVFVNIIIEYFK